MLTNGNYEKGMVSHEQIKYNINYDKCPLFDIVCAGMASRLLNHEYSVDLTDEQRDLLQKIINKE